MSESALKGDNIPVELKGLFQRLEVNAATFGMSLSELESIKKECKIAFQHKKILEKVKNKLKPK